MSQSDTPRSFLGRWSRLKQQSRQADAVELPETPTQQDVAEAPTPFAETAEPATQEEDTPPPTLEDVESLSFNSDYQPFLKANVSPDVKNAAMKKLFFSDPHFNTMDGLDIYIEDYNATHQPLPLSIIKKLASSKALSLFDEEPTENPPANPAPASRDQPPSPDAATDSPALPAQAPTPATPDPARRSHSAQAIADTDQPDSSQKRV